MRFPIRWILFAMAYLALAAAAFAQVVPGCAEILWSISLLAIVHEALMAVFSRGRRQMAAAGFTLASVGLSTCLAFGATVNVAIGRILMGEAPGRKIPDLHTYVTAAEAIAITAFGLMGSVVGLVVFRSVHARVE